MHEVDMRLSPLQLQAGQDEDRELSKRELAVALTLSVCLRVPSIELCEKPVNILVIHRCPKVVERRLHHLTEAIALNEALALRVEQAKDLLQHGVGWNVEAKVVDAQLCDAGWPGLAGRAELMNDIFFVQSHLRWRLGRCLDDLLRGAVSCHEGHFFGVDLLFLLLLDYGKVERLMFTNGASLSALGRSRSLFFFSRPV